MPPYDPLPRHFQVYLHGRDFTVQTDHRALEHLLSSNKLNGRLARWALFLQMFKITIRYRPGSANNNADGLSRQAWPENPHRQVSMFLIFLIKLLTQFPFVSFLSISILSLLNPLSSPSPPSLLPLHHPFFLF